MMASRPAIIYTTPGSGPASRVRAGKDGRFYREDDTGQPMSPGWCYAADYGTRAEAIAAANATATAMRASAVGRKNPGKRHRVAVKNPVHYEPGQRFKRRDGTVTYTVVSQRPDNLAVTYDVTGSKAGRYESSLGTFRYAIGHQPENPMHTGATRRINPYETARGFQGWNQADAERMEREYDKITRDHHALHDRMEAAHKRREAERQRAEYEAADRKRDAYVATLTPEQRRERRVRILERQLEQDAYRRHDARRNPAGHHLTPTTRAKLRAALDGGSLNATNVKIVTRALEWKGGLTDGTMKVLRDILTHARTHANPNKHRHARVKTKDGRTLVVKSVSRCRTIPGFHDVDPLTLPFRERPGTVAKYARMHGLTLSEARHHLRTKPNPAQVGLFDAAPKPATVTRASLRAFMAEKPKRPTTKKKNPRVTKAAIRAAVQAGAEAANARMRAEEAAATAALGASAFTWKGSTAGGEARGSRFLDHADPCLRPFLKTTPTGVALKMPPSAPLEAKYAAHSAFNMLSDYFTDWWKARNAFDAWVDATGGWDG